MKRAILIAFIFLAQTAYAGVSTMHIQGTFDVKITPQASADAPAWGRMRLDKTFHGELSGSSAGEMLAVRTETKGSAGYVALEKVDATLGGRKGSFFLQHSGLMNRGAASLTVTVVPDSGTGELLGLTGSMSIDVVDGLHKYNFDYALPAQ
jgi:hypothetical protein